MEAGEKIEPHYFQIPTAGSGGLKYRERVYCYELYHQLRIALGDDFPYKLAGEMDKAGHPLIRPTLGPKKPDFIVHIPGRMNKNLVIIQVKPITVEHRDLGEDIKILRRFLEEASYCRAIMLIYGDKERRNRIIQRAKDLIGNNDRILLIWHRRPRERPVTFTGMKCLEDEFFRLQKYGAKKAKEMKLTEKDIERLIFEGR
jgi:hypothetical protein